jgi:hypothetical protein
MDDFCLSYDYHRKVFRKFFNGEGNLGILPELVEYYSREQIDGV